MTKGINISFSCFNSVQHILPFFQAICALISCENLKNLIGLQLLTSSYYYTWSSWSRNANFIRKREHLRTSGFLFIHFHFPFHSVCWKDRERLSFRYITFKFKILCYPFDPGYGRKGIIFFLYNNSRTVELWKLKRWNRKYEQQRESLILADDLLIQWKLN